MHNYIIKYLFQSNFSAPVKEKLTQGGKVLDVACGPGTWLLELASNYKESKFFGLDIKPVFPQEIKPSNLEFIKADMFDGLPFHDNEFDFTHIESVVYILTRNQWDFVFSELIRVTKPGGYIEITDLYLKINDKSLTFYKLYEGLYKSCLRRNVDINLIYNLDSILKLHQNIEPIRRIEKNFIFGPNGEEAGLIYQEVATLFLSTKMAIKDLSAEIGISEEEYKNMVRNLKEELKLTHSAEGCVIRFWTQKI
ncbi:S-adenosyl-L-methionine-dependent methyltransferase [Glomus cerebriforme]|uniref:S-adenosyl-L-methionine-dependent methyltransferase n=1 Tax=Glomus cerebriforme TaxID=658196 RepID=A0A397TQL2_9GLOM|nr:S-adenosyl-L-methionine-dependent methyltransferase [Glomus cerebriforme]